MDILKHNGFPLRYNGAPLYWERGGGIPTDYIAFWKLNGDYTEETGTYTATPTNSPTFTTGRFGQALQTNGSNQYVTTSLYGQTFAASLKPFSVSFWYKTTDSPRAFMMGATDGNGSPFLCGIESGPSLVGNTGAAPVWTSSDVNNGTWHHVVVRKTASLCQLWVNGVLKDSVTAVAGHSNNNPLTFGRHGTYNGLYYAGLLEYVRVYNYAISDADITALYNES